MFKDAQSFDQDISNWKLDGIVRMTSMLDGAKSFKQNLCAWGKQPAVQLALSNGNAKDMFRDSGCNLQITPQNDRGPFCASCNNNGVRVMKIVSPSSCSCCFLFLLILTVSDFPSFVLRPTRRLTNSYSAGKSPVAQAMASLSPIPIMNLQHQSILQ